MTELRSNRKPKLFRGAVVAVAVTALAVTGGASASAQEAPSGNQFSPDQPRSEAVGEAEVLRALQRDLDLTAAEAENLLATQGPAVELNHQLQEELGEAFVGSWFDQSGALTVAVTDAAAAAVVDAAGVASQVASHTTEELESITERLEALAESEPAALEGVVEWGVELQSNQVVVTVLADEVGEVAPLVEQFDDAVRIETTDYEATLAQQLPFLDGAIPYNTSAGGCSVGFNLRNNSTGQRFFVTAGHCHPSGLTASSQGNTIGPVVASFFPGFDDGLVRIDNSFWAQGPWVWTYPGFITVRGQTTPPLGTAMCASGRTTGVTCGTVQAHNQSVNFGGQVVNNLTRHSACVLPGDSGGSNYTSGTNLAIGTSTGTQMTPGGQCVSPPVGWYFPTNISLPFYQSAFGAVLLTG